MENTATPSAFTSGPWKIVDHLATSRKASDYYDVECDAANINLRGLIVARTWTRDNARLIAAAPSLLEYCKGFLDDVRQLEADPDVASNWDWTLTKKNLEWLIDKAEGSS